MEKIAYVILETSGADCEKDDIIRFTAFNYNKDGKMIVFDKYAKSRNPLSPEFEDLTGIKQSDIAECDPSNIVKVEFLSFIKDATIIGCNLDYYEKCLDISFSKKIDLSKSSTKSTTKFAPELQWLIKLGDILAANAQQALHHIYSVAQKTIDAFDSSKNKNIDDNFFMLSKEERIVCIQALIDEKVCDFGFDIDIIYPRLRLEFNRILELDLVTDFLVAKAIADTLATIEGKPHFIGMGCCSVIAYILGITGQELNPIQHGLIFQRGFPKDVKPPKYLFGFYVDKSNCARLVNELKNQFGENVTLTENDGESILSINGIEVRIITEIGILKEQYSRIDMMIETSTIGVFQEDYMHLLHLVTGCSFDKANDIRKIISKKNEKAISEEKNNFISSTGAFLPLVESEYAFDNIVKGLQYAPSKAWILSVKVVLDEKFPC